MAFRLREDEPVAKGLSRLVRKQLRSAVERLTSDGSDEAIHDARKRIKKVRAVLHLAGTDLGGDRALKRLRRGSHALSPLRDMDAMIEAARTLRPSRSAGQTTLAGEFSVVTRSDIHTSSRTDRACSLAITLCRWALIVRSVVLSS